MVTIDTPANIVNGTRGQTICTQATWIDVGRFIALNYITHAFTVIQGPGTTITERAGRVLMSLFLPLWGTARVMPTIRGKIKRLIENWKKLPETEQQKIRREDRQPLLRASRAEAFRMIIGFDSDGNAEVPAAFKAAEITKKNIDPDYLDDIGNTHGQNPVKLDHYGFLGVKSKRKDEETPDDPSGLTYHCYRLPRPFITEVYPLIDGPIQLASQFDIVKGIAAIVQIMFASKALYDARGRQIDTYGYGAYGLTVMPYLWMSFMNLLAGVCDPQYSHNYIVQYGGLKAPDPSASDQEIAAEVTAEEKTEDAEAQNDRDRDEDFNKKIAGAVGLVYGDPRHFKKPSHEHYNTHNPLGKLHVAASIFVWGCSLALPYVVIYTMTGFLAQSSTVRERLAVLGWLVAGQIAVIFEPFVWRYLGAVAYGIWLVSATIVLGGIGVWSVVTVGNMILASGTCIRV